MALVDELTLKGRLFSFPELRIGHPEPGKSQRKNQSNLKEDSLWHFSTAQLVFFRRLSSHLVQVLASGVS
jgi:hypothetical protein